MPAAGVLVLFLSLTAPTPAAEPTDQAAPALDKMLAAYTAGDHAIVARMLARSSDFQRNRLMNRERMERWLAAWNPHKAAMLIEMADQSATIGPAYTTTLLGIGQRYVLARAVGSSPADDAVERRFHAIALGILQKRFLAEEIARYVTLLEKSRPRPTANAVLDARLDFARAIGQEQTCRLLHATARHDRLLAEFEGAAATPPAERQRAIECVERSLTLFDAAAARPETRDEARTRTAFSLFQLGRTDDAHQALTGANPGEDRALVYWHALLRGRVADAREADADAERAYRDALTAYPDAHTAGIGLALALFRMRRDDDAETAMRMVHKRSMKAVDPWDTYYGADGRFVSSWIGELRESLR